MKTSSIFITTILAICVSFLEAIDGIVVRILSSELHPFLIVFYRSLFGLIIITPGLIGVKHASMWVGINSPGKFI